MGIDRIEHFMGGDAHHAATQRLRVARTARRHPARGGRDHPALLKRNVYYDATVSAYGYWYNPKDMRVFTHVDGRESFLTPHAREVAEDRCKTRASNEQFKRIYDVKLKEVKRFYDAGGGRLITSGTDHPSWGEFLSGFGTHRELQTRSCSPAFRRRPR